jgi:hypothetical protein
MLPGQSTNALKEDCPVRQKLIISVLAVIVATVVLAAGASDQSVSLPEQLAALYKLVKMGSDSSGYSVVEEGTLLSIQKGNILPASLERRLPTSSDRVLGSPSRRQSSSRKQTRFTRPKLTSMWTRTQ